MVIINLRQMPTLAYSHYYYDRKNNKLYRRENENFIFVSTKTWKEFKPKLKEYMKSNPNEESE